MTRAWPARLPGACALGAALITALIASSPGVLAQAQRPAVAGVIEGVVRGPGGPEAGVWVIAETADLPTRFRRIVVTDDQGRFLVPELPKAKYEIWARGYGLLDTAKTTAEPGGRIDITASAAPDEATAAQLYPAIHWFAMMKIPPETAFDGKTIPGKVKQTDWLNLIKNNGCVGCHQLGQASTRTLPPALGPFKSHAEAWERRVQSGQSGESMVNILAGQLGGAPFEYFGDWTERIAKGELPKAKPARPSGLERNLVVTTWDWLTDKHYLHDLISSDRRNPTVNAYGKLFGSTEYSTDLMPILDPVTHTATVFKAPVTIGMKEMLGPGHAASVDPLMPSPYWGSEKIWDSRTNNHNGMFDGRGRVWFAASFRDEANPDFCKKGSAHPSAKVFPIEKTNRTLTVLDPVTMKYTWVDTCFQTHHLQFGYDKDNTLWTSGGGPVLGWLNTRVFDETGDAAKAQGWTPLVLDTNGNGKRDSGWVEPNQPVDPAKDKRIVAGFYAVMPHTDGSVWGTYRANPGAVVRVVPGSDPSETALAELYNVPLPGFGPRGGDIDSKGVVWVPLASGHLGAFDRTKCKGPLNGPTATGDHCKEGWTFHQLPGPGFEGIGPNSAESSYYVWVDQHDTLGLGKDVPILTGNLSDGFIAFKDGRFVMLRIPYPLGFYAKGLDGRIDDPAAGWKGRGLWSTTGDRTPWLKEGGKGTKPYAVQIQVRPDPLAR